jgi:16S rRNA (cytidine1402-2'-O)-methyltransferase
MDPDSTLQDAQKAARQGILSSFTPQRPAPGLYLVATPIGHASDITLRALEVLATCDLILCEDTRVTAKLLALYAIRNTLEPYHEHNAAKVRPQVLRRLADGEVIALVSDAGTPLISDPGYRLALEAREAGCAVTACPGASAALTGLSLSGLPTDRFLFVGFLPAKSGARQRAIEEVAGIKASLIFYESAHRLVNTLSDLSEILGDRPGAVCRELTKKFEEVRSGSVKELCDHYTQAGPPRGEIVIVVGGSDKNPELSAEELDQKIEAALAQMSLKDAAAQVATETGLARKRVYQRALDLRDSKEGS